MTGERSACALSCKKVSHQAASVQMRSRHGVRCRASLLLAQEVHKGKPPARSGSNITSRTLCNP